jgi:4-hydroxybenzoate polyprenyltransferase
MGNYVRIARFDHCIKQLFALPGAFFAYFVVSGLVLDARSIACVILALLATTFAASANYIINEWLDRDFDKYHPVKKRRPAVSEGLDGRIVYAMYAVFLLAGLGVAAAVNASVLAVVAALLAMGVVYNVKPFRTKDLPYCDILSESVNNALRLLIGWFAVAPALFPPSSIVFGYWMGGAFLMAAKRFSEYRAIGDSEQAGLYRKSFVKYSEKTLLLSSFFYACISVFLCGVFMIKYRIELLVAIPVLCGLFTYYLKIAFDEDSPAQNPEKLFQEKGLVLYIAGFVALVVALMVVDIPVLHSFSDAVLINVSFW